MPHHVALVDKITCHALHSEGLDSVTVNHDTARTLQGILGLQRFTDRGCVDYRIVEDRGSGMLVELANVIRSGQTKALVRLRHEVANIYLHCPRSCNGLWNSTNQQVRHEAGE